MMLKKLIATTVRHVGHLSRKVTDIAEDADKKINAHKVNVQRQLEEMAGHMISTEVEFEGRLLGISQARQVGDIKMQLIFQATMEDMKIELANEKAAATAAREAAEAREAAAGAGAAAGAAASRLGAQQVRPKGRTTL